MIFRKKLNKKYAVNNYNRKEIDAPVEQVGELLIKA